MQLQILFQRKSIINIVTQSFLTKIKEQLTKNTVIIKSIFQGNPKFIFIPISIFRVTILATSKLLQIRLHKP